MTLSRLSWASWARGGWINKSETLATLNLPAGKVFAQEQRLAGTISSDLITRGFPYVYRDDGSIPDIRKMSFLEVPQIYDYAQANLGGKVTANWTQAETIAFVNTVHLYGVTTHSWDEGYNQPSGPQYGNYTFPTGSQIATWANDALAARINAANPKPILIASYAAKYLSGQDIIYQSQQEQYGGTQPRAIINSTAARNALASQANARAGIDFYGLSISSTARANLNIYPGVGLRNVNGGWSDYIIAYQLLRLRKASDPSLPPLGFTWCSLEQGGYTGSFGWRHELTAGTLYQFDEAFWSLNKCYGITALCLLLGGGQALWNRPDKLGIDPTKLYPRFAGDPTLADTPPDQWKPKVNGTAPPTQNIPGFPPRPEASNDAHVQAAVDLGTTFSAAGTNFVFARYRVNKGSGYGAWYEVPTDIPEAALLDAAQDYRGICLLAQTGNDTGLYYKNPGNTLVGELVQVDAGNGRIITFDCYGQEPVVIYGNLAANTSQTLLRSGAASYTQPPAPAGSTLAFDVPNFIYNNATNKLIVAVTGVVGTPTFTIVGVIGNSVQPSDGFTITSNAIGTELTIRVKTPTQSEIEVKYTAPTGTAPVSSTGWLSTHFAVGPNVYISLEGNQANLDDRLRVMTTAKNGGCNFCSLVVSFSSMQYQNWDTLNAAGNKAKQLGMKIRLVYDLAPTVDWINHASTAYLPAVSPSLVRQTKQDGSTFVGNGNTVSFSMWDSNAIQLYVDTTALWTSYIKTQDWSSEVVAVEAGFGSTVELQYDFATYVGNNTVPILAGYEAPALAAFKVQMQNKFSTIGAMNSACGTSFSSFDALTFPTPTTSNPASAFSGVYGSYFALHRTYGIKKFTDAVYGKLNQLAPTWTRILDSGAFHDNISLQRGTTNPALLAGSLIQMRKSNGQVGFIHARDMDACSANGLMAANELDYAGDTGSTNQAVSDKYTILYESYKRGAKLVTLNCYNISDTNLNALLNYTDGSGGGLRPTIAAMIAAGPVSVARNVVQTYSFDQWTHLYDDNVYNRYQDWLTLYNNNGGAGIDIQYQAPAFTA